MVKKYIVVAGVCNTEVKVVDGDRETNQGNEVLLLLDKHLEVSTIIKTLKQLNPDIVIVSNGLLSVTNDVVLPLNIPRYNDKAVLDDFILTLSRAVLLEKTGLHIIYRVSDILNPKTKPSPIGDIMKVLKEVSNLQ